MVYEKLSKGVLSWINYLGCQEVLTIKTYIRRLRASFTLPYKGIIGLTRDFQC
jgi:hypothetical protein